MNDDEPMNHEPKKITRKKKKIVLTGGSYLSQVLHTVCAKASTLSKKKDGKTLPSFLVFNVV